MLNWGLRGHSLHGHVFLMTSYFVSSEATEDIFQGKRGSCPLYSGVQILKHEIKALYLSSNTK